MAQLLDWKIVSTPSATTIIPDDTTDTYDLHNLIFNHVLKYGSQDNRINLAWGDAGSSDNRSCL